MSRLPQPKERMKVAVSQVYFISRDQCLPSLLPQCWLICQPVMQCAQASAVKSLVSHSRVRKEAEYGTFP